MAYGLDFAFRLLCVTKVSKKATPFILIYIPDAIIAMYPSSFMNDI